MSRLLLLGLGPMYYSSWAFNYSLSHKLLTNFTNKLKKVVGWWVSPGLLCFSPSLVAYLHILCGANKICNFLSLSLLCSPLGIDCWYSGQPSWTAEIYEHVCFATSTCDGKVDMFINPAAVLTIDHGGYTNDCPVFERKTFQAYLYHSSSTLYHSSL